MSNAEALFDEYTKLVRPSGGRLEVSTLNNDDHIHQLTIYKEHAQGMIDSYVAAIRNFDGTLNPDFIKPIHFDYINNTMFNASAFKHKSEYFIGFNYGTVLIVMDAFFRIMSRNDTLVSIGSTEVFNNDDVFPLTNDFVNVKNYYDSKSDGYQRYVENKERNEYASMMITMALDFLLFHEVSHIVQGHLETKVEMGGVCMFMELYEIESFERKFKPLDSQVLEFDADSLSASLIFDKYWGMFKNDELIVKPKTYFDNSEHGIILTWCLSVWLIFKLTNLSRRISVSFSDLATYPSLPVRQLNSIHQAVQQIRHREDVDKTTLPNTGTVYNVVTTLGDEIIDKITGAIEKSEPSVPYSELSKKVQDLSINIYWKHLKSLMPTLKKYIWTYEPKSNL